MQNTTSAFVITEEPQTPTPKGQSAVLTIALEASPVEVEARSISALLPSYFEQRRKAGVSASAIDNYRKDLRSFIRWWETHGPQHQFIFTPAVLHLYGESLHQPRNGKVYSRGTIDTYTRRTRQFLRWLYTSGRLPIDISQWVPAALPPPPSTHKLEPKEIESLFHACAGVSRIRNMAILAFMLESGARRMEAAALEWDNVTFDGWRGYAHLAVAKRYLYDDRARTVVFGEVSGKLMQMLGVIQDSAPDPRVFRISKSGITQIMEALRRKAGVEFSPHDLRRTFATHWIRHCAAPNPDVAERLLEVQLGHSPRTVTQRHYMALTHVDVAQHYTSPLSVVSLPGLNKTHSR